jgi:hypothetical protein
MLLDGLHVPSGHPLQLASALEITGEALSIEPRLLGHVEEDELVRDIKILLMSRSKKEKMKSPKSLLPLEGSAPGRLEGRNVPAKVVLPDLPFRTPFPLKVHLFQDEGLIDDPKGPTLP